MRLRWRAKWPAAINGYAVIRFLDSPKGEDVPFVRLWEHRFRGPMGNWYVEKCLTTLGKQDPVAEHNNVLWNSGAESDKAGAGPQAQIRVHKQYLHHQRPSDAGE